MLWSDISFFGVPVMICVAVFTRLYYFPIIFSEAELAQIDDDGTAIDDGPPPFPPSLSFFCTWNRLCRGSGSAWCRVIDFRLRLELRRAGAGAVRPPHHLGSRAERRRGQHQLALAPQRRVPLYCVCTALHCGTFAFAPQPLTKRRSDSSSHGATFAVHGP